MSGFLTRLAERSLGLAPVAAPRLPSRYEAKAETGPGFGTAAPIEPDSSLRAAHAVDPSQMAPNRDAQHDNGAAKGRPDARAGSFPGDESLRRPQNNADRQSATASPARAAARRADMANTQPAMPGHGATPFGSGQPDAGSGRFSSSPPPLVRHKDIAPGPTGDINPESAFRASSRAPDNRHPDGLTASSAAPETARTQMRLPSDNGQAPSGDTPVSPLQSAARSGISQSGTSLPFATKVASARGMADVTISGTAPLSAPSARRNMTFPPDDSGGLPVQGDGTRLDTSGAVSAPERAHGPRKADLAARMALPPSPVERPVQPATIAVHIGRIEIKASPLPAPRRTGPAAALARLPSLSDCLAKPRGR